MFPERRRSKPRLFLAAAYTPSPWIAGSFGPRLVHECAALSFQFDCVIVKHNVTKMQCTPIGTEPVA
jgi:hypothetical protein